MHLSLSLRAHAASKMRRQRAIQCYRAAVKPALRAECSTDQRLNSHNADKVELERMRIMHPRLRASSLVALRRKRLPFQADPNEACHVGI